MLDQWGGGGEKENEEGEGEEEKTEQEEVGEEEEEEEGREEEGVMRSLVMMSCCILSLIPWRVASRAFSLMFRSCSWSSSRASLCSCSFLRLLYSLQALLLSSLSLL